MIGYLHKVVPGENCLMSTHSLLIYPFSNHLHDHDREHCKKEGDNSSKHLRQHNIKSFVEGPNL